MKQCQGLAYPFPVMYKVLSSHHILAKSDFIKKIPGMCIDCIFRNQSMFIKSIAFWYIKETMNQFTQWFSTSIGDPIIYRHCNISSTPVQGNPSFQVGLAGMYLVRLCIIKKGFNIKKELAMQFYSYLSFLISNIKWITKLTPNQFFNDRFTIQ